MKRQRFDPGTPEAALGTRQARLFPDVTDRPFRAAFALLEPGRASDWHAHLDGEMFVVLSGVAELETAEGCEALESGDAVALQAGEAHRMRNPSDSEPFGYLKIWWDSQVAEPRSGRIAPAVSYVTATPPTPNGDLHLGHLSGPYLRADIYCRYLRMIGRDAVLLTGIDDHQSYVATRAEGLGENPEITAERFGAQMARAWAAADIAPDVILRPRALEGYAERVQGAVRRLMETGHIVAREAPALICAETGRSLFEAHVTGLCPHCHEPSNGNACEACCRPNDCHDLLEPRSLMTAGPVARTSYTRLFFRLSALAEPLAQFVRRAQLSTPLRALAERMLADGLPDIPVSHRAHWGLPVNVDGFEGQRVYVWFEMAIGYQVAAAQVAGPTEAWSDPDTEIVQFFGMDNGYFHALLFPAIYMALGEAQNLPRAMLTNEFLRLDGAKFSTSRNHALWAGDFLKSEPSDLVRYVLARRGPERSQTDFTLAGYRSTLAEGPLGPWRDWLERIDIILTASFNRRAPATGLLLPDHAAFLRNLAALRRGGLEAFERETFSPARAARILEELVLESATVLDGEMAASRTPSLSAEWRTAIALQLSAVQTFALLLTPLMPRAAERLWRALGDRPLGQAEPDEPRLVMAGRSIAGLAQALAGEPASASAGIEAAAS